MNTLSVCVCGITSPLHSVLDDGDARGEGRGGVSGNWRVIGPLSIVKVEATPSGRSRTTLPLAAPTHSS